MDRQTTIKKLRLLQSQDVDIGNAPKQTYLGKVAIVGATNASGFGFNLAKGILNSHPENYVTMTASKKRSLERLINNVKTNSHFNGERYACAVFDVRKPTAETIGECNILVLCPAYMNPTYLDPSVKFEEIPEEVKEESRTICVYGFSKSVKAVQPKKSAWAVTFAVHHDVPNFLGYNIGPIKKELEDLITGETIVVGIKQNAFSLGAFESVASLGVKSFYDAYQLYKKYGLQNPSMRSMVYGAIEALSKEYDKTIVSLDGGLRAALEKDHS